MLFPLMRFVIETEQSSPRAGQQPALLLPLTETDQSSPRAGQEPALLLPLVQFLIETDQSKPRTRPEAPGGQKGKFLRNESAL